jgi:hypothetical protein
VAYKREVVNVAIPTDFIEEVRRLPLPKNISKTDTKRILYVLRIGIAAYAYSNRPKEE